MTVLLDGPVVGGTAFEKLFEAHHAEIHRYLRRVITREAAADDLLEETFLLAFRARRSLHVDTDLRAWLFAIATHLCRNHSRRERRQAVTSTKGEERRRSPNRVRAEREAVHDARGRLEAIIRRLPVSPRLAFTMRKFHDLGYDTIGASLSCTAGRARIHVVDALRRIRRELDRHCLGSGGRRGKSASVTRDSHDGTRSSRWRRVPRADGAWGSDVPTP
jgi:RNA polymerase sigma factor (sigma-70 family)